MVTLMQGIFFSMGGAIAVHVGVQGLLPTLIGLAVIDVVEGKQILSFFLPSFFLFLFFSFFEKDAKQQIKDDMKQKQNKIICSNSQKNKFNYIYSNAPI